MATITLIIDEHEVTETAWDKDAALHNCTIEMADRLGVPFVSPGMVRDEGTIVVVED